MPFKKLKILLDLVSSCYSFGKENEAIYRKCICIFLEVAEILVEFTIQLLPRKLTRIIQLQILSSFIKLKNKGRITSIGIAPVPHMGSTMISVGCGSQSLRNRRNDGQKSLKNVKFYKEGKLNYINHSDSTFLTKKPI